MHCLRRDVVRLVRGHPSRAKAIMVTLTNRGFHAILLYRLAHSLWKKGIPLFPMIFARISQHLFSVDISYKARLGPGIVIVHGFGVVIGSDTEIAGDCCIFHGVTLGDRGSEWVNSDREDGHPRVGREVMFGAGAKVLGPIRIGDNSVIGANAVVLSDVPPNSVAAGIPAKVVSQRKPPHWVESSSPSLGTPGTQVAPLSSSPGMPGEGRGGGL
jgi:serine O-acetyltransferase